MTASAVYPRRPALVAAALAAAAGLAACQSGPGNVTTTGESPAFAMMQHISSAAQTCWFRSGADEFEPYRLADELNSYSGRPRILLVPATNPEARPLLVVQAQGSPAKVEVFGPLMDQPVGSRIAADVRHWSGGGTGCSASA